MAPRLGISGVRVDSAIRIISSEYQISMENLEAIVRVGKEIWLTEEELQSWVKEEQDFLIGEQKWCKNMMELKEKKLTIQEVEIKELMDNVEKKKEERENIEKRHCSEIQKMKEELVNMNELMSKKGENETVEKKTMQKYDRGNRNFTG